MGLRLPGDLVIRIFLVLFVIFLIIGVMTGGFDNAFANW